MQVFKNIIEQFMDKELLIIIGCIIVFLILLRVLSNFLSRHKLIKTILIGVILVLLVLGIFWFVENRKDFYSNNATRYVYGEVKNISSAVRKVEIRVTKSNIKYKASGYSLTDKTVVVDMDINCKFLDKNGKQISFNDINFYDTVQIYVKEDVINDLSRESLSGVKLIQKINHSEGKNNK